MSDFRDLCEDSGLSAGDPGAIDALIDMYCDEAVLIECEKCNGVMEDDWTKESFQMHPETGEMHIASMTFNCLDCEHVKTIHFPELTE